MKKGIVSFATACAIATGLAFAASAVQADQAGLAKAEQFTRVSSLSDLVARIGRKADTSEQGGACGGIVVHDWLAENIRVIALGDMIQVVSPLRDAD